MLICRSLLHWCWKDTETWRTMTVCFSVNVCGNVSVSHLFLRPLPSLGPGSQIRYTVTSTRILNLKYFWRVPTRYHLPQQRATKMWLTDSQSSCLIFQTPKSVLNIPLLMTEIGVALTTFGALFMILGVILFFDGALLALGNVNSLSPMQQLPSF